MNRVHFSDNYLGEPEFLVPSSHKLVFLFVLVFRGCKPEEIVHGLGLSAKSVDRALAELVALELVVVDGRGRCRLSEKRLFPLEQYREKSERILPSWYSAGEVG